MTSYTVDLHLDESGWWVAAIPAVPGCHTQGRSVGQAMLRIREALSLFINDAECADLLPSVHLPAAARRVVRKYESARNRVERDRRAAADAAREAVRVLTEEVGVSTRDAGELLGLSHQRVHQLKSGVR